MCALVLALRKIPVYAPGAGGAALGSRDSPSYSVAVSDADAAASRAAFNEAKDAKRMIPAKSAPQTTGFSSDTTANQSVASTVRNRSPTITTAPAPAAEKAALTTLNARQPASDPAHDWETNSNDSSPTDAARRRSNDIEGVRDMLRRSSTRGKRKGGNTLAPTMKQPGVPTIAEPSSDNYDDGIDYQEYAPTYTSANASSMQQISNSAAGRSRPGLSLLYPPQAASPPQSSLPETPTGHNAYQQQAKRPLLGTNNSFAQERAEKNNNPFFQDGAKSPRSPIEWHWWGPLWV